MSPTPEAQACIAIDRLLSQAGWVVQDMADLPAHLARWADRLVFDDESTGDETCFRDMRDPAPRSRRVFAFHQPATLHA